MKTYQDWLKVADKSENERMNFILGLINDHKSSQAYKDARNGENYYNGQNTTIKQVEKLIYNALGQAVPDYVSANHKIASRFFYRSVKQATSTLLGNGVSWGNGSGNKLGDDFDKRLIQIARGAMVEGCCFGFWNFDHVEVYDFLEFAPLKDEEDGAVKAGARFWQLASDKPLRVTFFELDGYTDYRFNKGEGEVMVEKRPYILKTRTSEAEGTEIYDGENYPSFPIIPCYSNYSKTSELNPIRPTIDSYDLINSGYANDIDDANIIYWTITNAGGMDDADLVKRVEDVLVLYHIFLTRIGFRAFHILLAPKLPIINRQLFAYNLIFCTIKHFPNLFWISQLDNTFWDDCWFLVRPMIGHLLGQTTEVPRCWGIDHLCLYHPNIIRDHIFDQEVVKFLNIVVNLCQREP